MGEDMKLADAVAFAWERERKRIGWGYIARCLLGRKCIATYEFEPLMYDDGANNIVSDMEVNQAYRRKGIGIMLLHYGMEQLQELADDRGSLVHKVRLRGRKRLERRVQDAGYAFVRQHAGIAVYEKPYVPVARAISFAALVPRQQ